MRQPSWDQYNGLLQFEKCEFPWVSFLVCSASFSIEYDF